MKLTQSQLRFLRAQAHHLNPVVLLGQNGLTENVLTEIDGALEHHELIKVRVPGMDREQKHAVIQTISERTGSVLVQQLGHVATLYRHRTRNPGIILPR